MDFLEVRAKFITLINTLDSVEGRSRELAMVKTKLQEAMMYSGAIHGVLSGQPSPYVNDGKRKSVEDIENFNESHSEVLETEGKIAILDEMRQILKGLTPMMRLALEEEPSPHTSTVIVALTQRTMEARMWLGMELGRIRDANK